MELSGDGSVRYSGENFATYGLDEDQIFDLELFLHNDGLAALPIDCLPSAKVLSSLYRLWGCSTDGIARVVESTQNQLAIIDANSIGDEADLITNSFRKRILFNTNAVMVLDDAFEKAAISITSEKGGNIDARKSALYRSSGLAMVTPLNTPTTQARIIRSAMTTAFIDGIPQDVDLTPTSILIHEKPLLVNGFISTGLRGEALRIFCTLVQEGNLTDQGIETLFGDHLSENDATRMRSAAEPFIYHATKILQFRTNMTEIEKTDLSREMLLDLYRHQIELKALPENDPRLRFEQTTPSRMDLFLDTTMYNRANSDILAKYFTTEDLQILIQDISAMSQNPTSIVDACKTLGIAFPLRTTTVGGETTVITSHSLKKIWSRRFAPKVPVVNVLKDMAEEWQLTK